MTVKEQTEKRINEMQEKKQRELTEAGTRLEEAQQKSEKAAAAAKKAAADMDIKAYTAAKAAQSEAQTEIAMYTDKRTQIAEQEYVTEAESDKTIDSLLDYEKELSAAFEQDIAGPLAELKRIQSAYQTEIAETEAVIYRWSAEIRENHNSRGCASYVDPTTGERSCRSPQPIPVHAVPYPGCNASVVIGGLLEDGGKLAEYVRAK